MSTDGKLREADRRAAADDAQDAAWIAARVRAGVVATWDCDEPRHKQILKCACGFPSTHCGVCEIKLGDCVHGCAEHGGVVVAADLGHRGARNYLRETGRAGETREGNWDWLDDVARRTSHEHRSIITKWLEHFFMIGFPVYFRTIAAAARAVLPLLCHALGHAGHFESPEGFCDQCRTDRLPSLLAVEEAVLGIETDRSRTAVDFLLLEKKGALAGKRGGLLETMFTGRGATGGFVPGVDYVAWRVAAYESVGRELLPWALGTGDPVAKRSRG